jgi:hypothetical protein
MRQSEYSPENEDERESQPVAFDGSPVQGNPHQIAAHGLGQMFGLHPAVAFLNFTVNSMIFAADWGTIGAFWPVSLVIGVVLGFITFRAQVAWFGDTRESAFIKAGILALLCGIPVPIPAVLSVPAGLVGLFRKQWPGAEK